MNKVHQSTRRGRVLQSRLVEGCGDATAVEMEKVALVILSDRSAPSTPISTPVCESRRAAQPTHHATLVPISDQTDQIKNGVVAFLQPSTLCTVLHSLTIWSIWSPLFLPHCSPFPSSPPRFDRPHEQRCVDELTGKTNIHSSPTCCQSQCIRPSSRDNAPSGPV